MDALVNLPGDLSSATRARELVRRTLKEWDLLALLDEAEIIISELVTNAVRHGKSPISVRLSLAGDRRTLRIGVHDADGAHSPVLRTASPEDTGGRGMRLVDVLATKWGWRVDDKGKEVWADLCC